MNRKEQAQQLANERSKHKQRLKSKGGLVDGLNPSRAEVDKAVLQAVADRIRSCLPSVKDICQAHRNRQRESVIRERIQRMQQQPAFRKLPYRWNRASFIERGASSLPGAFGAQQRAGSNADILNKELAALNAELLSFAKYSCLTRRETDLRETVVKDLTDAILCKWPRAKVKVFGSYPSGLSIFSSDLDISLQNMGVDVDFDGNEVMVSTSPSTLPGSESVVDLTVNEVIDLTGDAEEPVTWTFDVGKGLAGAPESGAKRKRGTEDCEEADEQGSTSDGAAAEDEGDSNSDGEGESQSESGESDASFSGGDEGEDGDGDESNWEQWESGERADDDLELNLSSSAASSSSSSRGRPSISESERKLRVQGLLKLVAAQLRGMGWCIDLDVRLKARVPIIALKHRCGLSVDISLGVAAEDHTTTVRQMIQSSTITEFFPICSFLKVFLAQLDLDKPFIGGVGSFKLYAMIAAVIQKRRASSGQSSPQPHSLAGILRLFFSHWGSPANLNERTKVVLPLPRLDDCDANAQSDKLEVAFDRVFKVGALQQAFKIADRVMSESLAHQRPTDCSILGRLIDATSFCDDRVKHSNVAKNYPLYSVHDKHTVARQLLQELHEKHHSAVPKSCSLEQLVTVCPSLVTRLLSYKDSHEALYPGGQGARRHSTMPPGATRNKKKKQKKNSATGGRNVIFGKGSQGVIGREMVLSASRGKKGGVFRS